MKPLREISLLILIIFGLTSNILSLGESLLWYIRWYVRTFDWYLHLDFSMFL